MFESILGTFDILSKGRLITKAVKVPNITMTSEGTFKYCINQKRECFISLYFKIMDDKKVNFHHLLSPICHACKEIPIFRETIAKANTKIAIPHPNRTTWIKFNLIFFFF